MGRAEQAASLTRELQKLVIELEEHRGKHYYNEHTELVKSALEGLRQSDGHNQKSAGEIQKSYLRSHIQSAMQAMPTAMKRASQIDLLNTSLVHAKRERPSAAE